MKGADGWLCMAAATAWFSSGSGQIHWHCSKSLNPLDPNRLHKNRSNEILSATPASEVLHLQGPILNKIPHFLKDSFLAVS
jgi:hypothetical protein